VVQRGHVDWKSDVGTFVWEGPTFGGGSPDLGYCHLGMEGPGPLKGGHLGGGGGGGGSELHAIKYVKRAGRRELECICVE